MNNTNKKLFKNHVEAFMHLSEMCSRNIHANKVKISRILETMDVYKKYMTNELDTLPVNFPGLASNSKGNDIQFINLENRHLIDLTFSEVLAVLESALKRYEKQIAKYESLLNKLYSHGTSSHVFNELCDEFRIEIVSEGDE